MTEFDSHDAVKNTRTYRVAINAEGMPDVDVLLVVAF
jgi:hypothetical protein